MSRNHVPGIRTIGSTGIFTLNGDDLQLKFERFRCARFQRQLDDSRKSIRSRRLKYSMMDSGWMLTTCHSC